MLHTMRAAPAEAPRPTLSPRHNRDTKLDPLDRSRGVGPLARSAVAGAMLLITTESTLAQVAGAPAAIATEGAGPLGLGALVGAVVAGGFALRERFRRR
jgi:hypothetical protein